MRHLIDDILDNAYENDKLDKSNLLSQANKIARDAEDLTLACRFKAQGKKEFIKVGSTILKTDEEVKKAFGKLLYELVILAEITEIDLETELRETYKQCK